VGYRLKISRTFSTCLTLILRLTAECAGQSMANILAGLASRTPARRRAFADQLRTSSRRLALSDAVCDLCVREGDQTYDKVNEVPAQLRNRVLAVRSFDTNANGNEIELVLQELLATSNVDYLHIHFAAAGCYAARVERAS
jgi:uncharacterized protein DUF1203